MINLLGHSKVFITGGSGFIGSYIAEQLVSEGFSVTVFDRREPPPQLRRTCKYIQGDLLDLSKVANVIEGHDVVYHLAANADISMGVKNTYLDLEQTTLATYNVLEAMRRCDTRALVFLSGSGVYGDVGSVAVSELHGPLMPVSLYGASKLAAEGLICAFSNMFGMRAVILRPANVVGGGQTHGVLFDFVQKLRTNPNRLEILGDGLQTKSYLHIDDLYAGIKIAWQDKTKKVSLFNIASDDTTSVNQIADQVISALGLNSVEITHTPGTTGWIGDVPRICMQTGKLKSVGWKPSFTSNMAIEKALVDMLTNITD